MPSEKVMESEFCDVGKYCCTTRWRIIPTMLLKHSNYCSGNSDCITMGITAFMDSGGQHEGQGRSQCPCRYAHGVSESAC